MVPDRMLRSGLIWSEKINSVSVHAESLFVRLLLAADDFGLVDLSPAGLKMRVLPGRNAEPKEIEEWCRELLEVGLLRGYEIDGKPFAAVVGWDQTRWAAASKLPMPPWGSEHITGGYVAPRAREKHEVKEVKEKRPKSKGSNPVPKDWEPKPETVEELSAEYRFSNGDAERYVAAFKDQCAAKGYTYKDFDAAFRNCVRKDWPGFRKGAALMPNSKDPKRLAIG